MPDRGVCSGCGAQVLWVRTPTGKAMPLDARPVTRGWTINEKDVATQHDVYQSHFASCPKASAFRRAAR